MTTPIEGALALWYLLVAGSLVLLLWDLFTNTPTGNVMKLAWVLVVLYTGPVGLVLYLLSCRQHLPGTHDAFIQSHWKQATGSLLHCVAGDATGIIFSAAIVYHFGLPNGIDLIIEYLSAFVVGLFVFQALFMVGMYGGNYLMAARKTFFAETVSMNMVMVGMIPTMLLLMHSVPESDNPFRAEFWGVMSLATMAGMVTAYPINSWMVKRGLKHGMMSAIPAPKAMAMEEMGDHAGMSESGMDKRSGMAGHTKDGGHAGMGDDPGKKMEMQMPHSTKEGHRAATLPKSQAVFVLVTTFGFLFVVIWVTARYVPIRF